MEKLFLSFVFCLLSLPAAVAEESPNGLNISGFFDVTASSYNYKDSPFQFGTFELDIQFVEIKNITVNSALVWNNDAADVAVAFVDYHAGNHFIPTRGRLFGEPGYHIQLGRFDIPFGIDYEYFAAPDRVNITAPLTTDIIQQGGLNSDGIRAYGTWSQFNYAFYITNSVFSDDGKTIGSRIGIFPKRDIFRIHNRHQQDNVNLGISWLQDSNETQKKTLYSVDLKWRYEFIEVLSEYVKSVNYDKQLSISTVKQEGMNFRFLLHFDKWLFFTSYGRLNTILSNANLQPTDNIQDRVIIAVNYNFTANVKLKLEYLTYFNQFIENNNLEKNNMTIQLVASF